MQSLYFLPLAFLLITGCATQPHPPLQTVKKLDINRYSGQWIEIARYENRFELGCAGASALYTINDGKIDIINRCYDEQGLLRGEANGKAHPTDTSNSKLKVSFFWPFYGDYQVIMLADDYRYSVVGEPSRKYLWILSRTPNLSDEDKNHILNELPHVGYDSSKLYWTTAVIKVK